MTTKTWVAVLVALGAAACGDGKVIGTVECMPQAAAETQCSDGIDDDCDGYPDCLDTECQGQACAPGGFVCTAGACLKACSGASCLTEVPQIDNVRVTMHGDNALIEFEPVAGAKDYRIYAYPAADDILVAANGEQVIKNAIYRCAGDRPIAARADDDANHFDGQLGGRDDTLQGYGRDPSQSVLGYVYTTPGAGRQPVYRVADPEGAGGFRNDTWVVPLYSEAAAADYVIGSDARDALLAKGWRDDGIAFYAPVAGTRPVYRRVYAPEYWGPSPTRYYVDGPEADARADDTTNTVEVAVRFQILPTEEPGSVPLHRLSYLGKNAFDILAAGPVRLQRANEQGNIPLWSVTWSGLSAEKKTFVVEALDAGCPFPNGYVSSVHADASYPGAGDYPTITLDEARLPSGEVYINGQHDPANRPKPIARAYVDLQAAPRPQMDWYEGFDEGAPWPPLDVTTGNNGVFIMRNDRWAADFSGCTPNISFAPSLGQLMLGFDDGGSSCNVSISPRALPTKLSSGKFLHVRMSSDIASTNRRYPQIMITTTPIVDPNPSMILDEIPLHARLGPLPYEMKPPGPNSSIIVQPFGGYHELMVELCDQRGWGVGNQCQQANVYGFHAGNYNEDWGDDAPRWNPVPVLGDLAGHDRPVQFDVYASTEKVYVFLDDKPAGCAVLPSGRMPAGDVTVAFRAVGYHLGVDDPAENPATQHQYLRRYSIMHSQRRMDDFGVELSVSAPAWDETTMPCGTRWYGG